jgi:hypothetical protein
MKGKGLALILILLTGALALAVDIPAHVPVSVGSDGSQANRSSYQPAISLDGRFVAFM